MHRPILNRARNIVPLAWKQASLSIRLHGLNSGILKVIPVHGLLKTSVSQNGFEMDFRGLWDGIAGFISVRSLAGFVVRSNDHAINGAL